MQEEVTMETINQKLENLIEEADQINQTQDQPEQPQQQEKYVRYEDPGNEILTCDRCNKKSYAREMYTLSYERDANGNNINKFLCQDCRKKLMDKQNDQTIGFIGLDHFKNAAIELIKGIEVMSGKDLSKDQNFIDTPNRVARAYWEILGGVRDTENRVQSILNTAFESKYDGIICANNITAWGLCPHHLLPVKFMIKKIGYVAGSNRRVLGISKLKRLVDILAAQPILQEDLADQITDALMSFGAEGAAVTISAVHCCMVMRGAKATGANVITSSMKGCFRHNPTCRAEFLAITENQEAIF